MDNAVGLDLRGVPCPLNAVRCQLAFEKLAVGEGLRVKLDCGEPLESVVNQFLDAGQQVDVEIRSAQEATVLITRLSP
ncbi:MAG: sulfurtransferase TusA family protein [Synechococcus sp. SB0668_bin_15]|nr:sulfurtransferase TusA family protein [Synechococcus sp. SB0668_bin_15]MXZ83216.1 sulfurtransferase TusA family protein [Synechococcus sp. SB0666_bin_14]MYA91513.1 sulfurtransferase TusA family protein [Synechococcus sp. SB0663_bin_10]MYC48771.1 sulfurtransferase TusA family protein [Synechococcus sp. SB0662_bin_14]MYG45926.1 sulfurtransferase TusA family protein [Synechococcus sp. SB0675_bin_6]MYJ59796.1 sulfurtransferase TusA family protein [Synechococcus sp. SB0672_bin_6]MYK91505.1 sulf